MGFIYSILNKITGKIYVGQTIQCFERFKKHKYELNHNKHPNPHLQSSWNKYGEDAFEFNVLEYCSDEKLDDNECWWIDYFDSQNQEKGYNLQSGGSNGYKHSEETKKKISESNKGKVSSMKGKHHSDETRKKMSINSPKYWEGKEFSEEHKQKLSENNVKYWKGKNRSDETKKKIAMTKSLKYNTTGYYRVSKNKSSDCKQGFVWRYQWTDGKGKRKSINSVNFEILNQKVISRGLPWGKISDFEGVSVDGS